MKDRFILLATLLILGSRLVAAPYVTYNGDDNQTPANPTGQGWTITGALNQGFTDASNGNTLGWELNDNNSDANPTMIADYGAANIPQTGDPWTLSVNCRVFAGNGTATNVIMWSDGTKRYLFFVYQNAAGKINLLYYGPGGTSTTLADYVVNDGGFHTWAMVHDGTAAKVTYDGADVVNLGSIAASGTARGVHVGGGSSGGTGALYIANVSYDATLAAASQTTRLGRVFSDHMVLQRGEPVKIFGKDTVDPGSQPISVSFAGQVKNTTSDAQGNWEVILDPMTANASGQSLVVTGSAETTIIDVLIGEVWLAAGQSNMNFRVNQSSTSPHPENYSLIRMCNWEGIVGTGASQVYNAADLANLTPENFYSGSWQVMDVATVQAQSGVAYFFVNALARELAGTGPGGTDVPIGIIDTSIGGTSTEAYISPTALQAEPHLTEAFQRPYNARNLGQWTGPRIFKNVYNNNVANYTQADPAKPIPHPYAPGFLYEVGIDLLKDFIFKGAIWYQGESNAEFTTGKYQINGNRLSDYQTQVMKTLVDDWRNAFGKPNFPIYMVELPRINAPNRAMWPYYREAQARVAKDVEGCELALVMEYGVLGDVHPPNKEPVGERLAAIARAKLYGQAITYSGPTYTDHTVAGNKIILNLDHRGGGLVDKDGGALRNFVISGADRNFVPATAVIVGDTIEVSAASVPNPVAARHAWEMNADVDLFNNDGFSSSSFRTDNWIVAPGRKLRVACIGDSITANANVADENKYPAELGKMLGTSNFEVRNYGKGGAGIYRVSNRYDESTQYAAAIAWSPDIVICNLGINDITGWNVSQHAAFEVEYFQLIDSFIQSGSVPLFIQWSKLAPLYPGQAFYGSPNLVVLNDWIRQVAASTSAILLDMETPLLDHNDWFPDHIHPNAAGTREIADTTFCLLDSIGDLDGQPLISEFLATNTNGVQDENGDYSGWLEISNRGSSGACLNKHYLTNHLGNLTQWQIPTSTVVEPGGNLLVFASGKNRAVNAAELHTNFTIPASGGSLALVAADGTTVLDSLSFPAQHPNISYGRSSGASSSLDHGAALSYHMPTDGSLGNSWTATAFDDSSWSEGNSGLGYDAGVISFDGSQIWNSGFKNGWTELNGAGTTNSLTGTILKYDHSGSGLATTLDGTASALGGTSWSSIRNGDWTVETNLKINASPNGFVLWFGIGANRIIVEIHNDKTKGLRAGSFSASHTNNDGAFHLFKVSHDSTAKRYHVWRDGVLLTLVGGEVYDLAGADSRLLLGDYAGGSFGDNFNVEVASISYTGSFYGGLIQTDVQSVLRNVNPSIYLRLPFTLGSELAALTSLKLDIQYDDGFVAYINGTEVARRNAPTSPLWDSTSVSDRVDSDALVPEAIDLAPHIALLNQGSNILAIQALNSSANANRLLINPVLTLNSPRKNLFFQTPTPDAGNGGSETGSLPFATWKDVHGIASDSSDDDHDGLTALMEFLSGTSPTSGSSAARPIASVTTLGVDDFLTVSFRIANGLSGLGYALESSDDLQTAPIWQTVPSPVQIASLDNGDGSSTMTYRMSTAMESIPRQFLRVGYSYSE